MAYYRNNYERFASSRLKTTAEGMSVNCMAADGVCSFPARSRHQNAANTPISSDLKVHLFHYQENMHSPPLSAHSHLLLLLIPVPVSPVSVILFL
jgi:hypothetical protein